MFYFLFLLFLFLISGLQTDEGLHLMEILARMAKIQMTDFSELSYVSAASYRSMFCLITAVCSPGLKKSPSKPQSCDCFLQVQIIHLSRLCKIIMQKPQRCTFAVFAAILNRLSLPRRLRSVCTCSGYKMPISTLDVTHFTPFVVRSVNPAGSHIWLENFPRFSAAH